MLDIFEKIIDSTSKFFSESLDNGMIYVYGSIMLILIVLITVGLFWISIQKEEMIIPKNLSIINEQAKGYCSSKNMTSYEIINNSKFRCIKEDDKNYTISELEIK